MERNEVIANYYEQYKEKVDHLVNRYIKNPEEREDAVQDTFEKVVRSWSTYNEEQGNFFAWLATIAVNTAYDHIRKLSKKPVDELPEDAIFEDTSFNPEDIVVDSDTSQHIWHAVDTLPIKRQEVVNLYYREDLTTQEIADRTGYSQGGVKSALFNARQELKPLLKEYYGT